MKKILLLMLMTLPFMITSCSDDDDDKKEVNKTSLEGTRWTARETEAHYEINLRFYKNTFEMNQTNGNDIVSISGTYEYEYPYVWMEYEGEIDKITIIDGNKFIIDLGDGDTATLALL